MSKSKIMVRILAIALACSLILSSNIGLLSAGADDRAALTDQGNEVGATTAIVEDGLHPLRWVDIDETETKWSSDFPDHPELYVPHPIPEPTEPVTVNEPDRLVSYNLVTGEEAASVITYEDLPLAAWIEGSTGEGVNSPSRDIAEEEVQPMSFSSLTQIANPEDYPWRVNCKLFFTQSGTGYTASGTLIDPMHVLTAGHCVHEGSGGSWSTDMVVIPAYEAGIYPYGYASGIQLHTWNGWSTDGNFDYDMGIIDLDRPIGALTGWHGYGYNSDCSFFTGGTNIFHNPGYPAASPYTGQYMYYWYGYFDECTTNQVKFYNQAYGGQSGSGAYYMDGSSNRYLYAELSNGTNTPPYWTRDVLITSTRFGHIGDMIADDTPSTFDLIPLDVNTSPATISAGNPLSSMDYLVHNYASVSRSGTVNVNVYLSTNEVISSSDTLLQSHSFTWTFGAKSSVRVTLTIPPTIPPGTPSGDYWIGVILDISDYNTNNNASGAQDVSPIYVQNLERTITFYADPTDGGTITFDGSTYSNGQSTTRPDGSYPASANPAPDYEFDHWTTTGGASVSNLNSQSTTATVTGDGSIKAWFNYNPAGEVNLSIQPPTETVGAGEIFELTIQADAGGQPVSGIDAFVDFNPGYLEVVDADAGTPGIQIIHGPALPTVIVNEADNSIGTVDFSAGKLGAPFPTGTFAVATIQFRALASTDPSTAVTFSTTPPRQTKADYAGDDVTGTLTGGTVIITVDAPIFLDPPSSEGICIGQHFTLEIKTNVDSEQEVSGVQAFIDFDPTYLEVLSVTPGASLPTVLQNDFDNIAGTIDYSAGKLGAPFPTGEFIVATIEFEALAETSSTPVTFSFSGPRTTAVDLGGSPIPGTHGDATVEIIPGAIVDISVVLQGGARPPEAWEVPITIKFFEPGADVMIDTPVYEFDLMTTKSDGTAICQCVGVMPGTYDITAKASNCPGCTEGNCTLTNVKRDVVISAPSTAVDMDTLLAGDADCNGIINISDFGILAVAYMCAEGEPCYDCRADFDCNGIINISDFGLLAVNYMQVSPVDIS